MTKATLVGKLKQYALIYASDSTAYLDKGDVECARFLMGKSEAFSTAAMWAETL